MEPLSLFLESLILGSFLCSDRKCGLGSGVLSFMWDSLDD